MGRARVVPDIGRRYGRLVVTEHAGALGGFSRCVCRCDCGATITVRSSDLRHPRSPTMSCGCLKKEKASRAAWKTKHGIARSRIYRIWFGMWRRCTNPRDKSFVSYGAKGVSVCDAWRDVRVFEAWALRNGYEDKLEIDRVNSTGNYEPSNCRFVTPHENRIRQRRWSRVSDSPKEVVVSDGIAMDMV